MNQNQWKAHVEACNASGLSKSKYAKQHDLVYHNFIYWSQKLAKKSVNDFVPVTVKPTKSADVIAKSMPVKAANEILGVVEFPNGARLVIHSSDLIAQLTVLLTGKV